jgi:hypothetical protein
MDSIEEGKIGKLIMVKRKYRRRDYVLVKGTWFLKGKFREIRNERKYLFLCLLRTIVKYSYQI